MSMSVAAGKAPAVVAGTVKLTKERSASTLTHWVLARFSSSWVVDDVQLIFSFVACTFDVISKNPLCNLRLSRFKPMFSSMTCID